MLMETFVVATTVIGNGGAVMPETETMMIGLSSRISRVAVTGTNLNASSVAVIGGSSRLALVEELAGGVHDQLALGELVVLGEVDVHQAGLGRRRWLQQRRADELGDVGVAGEVGAGRGAVADDLDLAAAAAGT